MRFFKVLVPGFWSKLWMPQAFCTKASGEYSAEAAVETRLGTWKIEVGNCKGTFYFRGGDSWDRFVMVHGLRVGDFIVFEHHGCMRFNALLFGPSGCEKDFPVINFGEDGKQLEIGSNSPQQYCGIPPFTKCTSASSLSHPRVYFPVEIWRPYGLHKKKRVILRIGGGKWSVKLRYYRNNTGRSGYLAMTEGWPEFCCSNKIQEGDCCTFQIMDAAYGDPHDDILIDVTVTPE